MNNRDSVSRSVRLLALIGNWFTLTNYPCFLRWIFPIVTTSPGTTPGTPGAFRGRYPLAARIFSVVDLWDALQSDRPYRKAWSKKQAIKLLKEQSGKQYDPIVVEAFFELTDIS